MKIFLKLLVFVVSLVFLSETVDAEGTAKTFIKTFKEGDADEKFIIESVASSFQNGVSWTNVYVKTTGGKAVYCPPQNIVIVGKQVINILERFVEDHPEHANSKYSGVLFLSLLNAFPCEKSQ